MHRRSTFFNSALLRAAFTASFLVTSLIAPAYASAQTVLDLPTPGKMVAVSPAFTPALLRGITVHPENPLQFDFIVNTGDEHLEGDALKTASQRLINYFLASLAVPEKDLWVNLSPAEKDRIIPDALNKTELGRDLLAQDYMLKQISASLIYPEKGLGKEFWQKIYDEAYQKYGVKEVPVSTFNKVWVLPENAAVIEKGNTVYVAGAHLKVMLEEDYLVLQRNRAAPAAAPSKRDDAHTAASRLIRQIVLPAIEKEVNEGKNFVRLRQVVYALVLAQWYQDVFKNAVLNKAYTGKDKVTGIDANDPKNKELIYQQYLAAYKKGVFNYIKEETDRVTRTPVPRKYFSGGFQSGLIRRERIDPAMLGTGQRRGDDVRVEVSLATVDRAEMAQIQLPHDRSSWHDNLYLPLQIQDGMQRMWEHGAWKTAEMKSFLEAYSAQVQAEINDGNPVQGAWPFLLAVVQLSRNQRTAMADFIEQNYKPGQRTRLMESILLMQDRYDTSWGKNNVPEVFGLLLLMLSMEIDLKSGGLGPVLVTLSKYAVALGLGWVNIQPKYRYRYDRKTEGEPLRYEDLGFTKLRVAEDGEFYIKIGPMPVKVTVWEGLNKENVPSTLIDVDGYNDALYLYDSPANGHKSREEVMAAFIVASVEWIRREAHKRARAEGAAYQLPVLAPQDGQLGPFIATLLSRAPELAGATKIYTTHTIKNAQDLWDNNRVVQFFREMLGVSNKYVPSVFMHTTFDRFNGGPAPTPDNIVYGNYTASGMAFAELANGVSLTHARDMSKWYERMLIALANGDNPGHIAAFFEESVSQLIAEGRIPPDVDRDRLSPEQQKMAKRRSAERFNAMEKLTADGDDLLDEARKRWGKDVHLQTLNDIQAQELMAWANEEGRGMDIETPDELRNDFIVKVNPDAPTLGNARRLVEEKNEFPPEFLLEIARTGFNQVIMGNYQNEGASGWHSRAYRKVERQVRRENRAARHEGRALPYPERFFFVKRFTEDEKIAGLGMFNVYLMLNQDHMGAHERLEENEGANYAYMVAYNHRGGGTTDALIPVSFEAPGRGSLVMLKYGGDIEEWMANGIRPLIDLYRNNPDAFFRGAGTARLANDTQKGVITVANYGWAVNDFKVREKEERRFAAQTVRDIVAGIKAGASPEEVVRRAYKIAELGPARQVIVGDVKPFEFITKNFGREKAAGIGLNPFLQSIQSIEDAQGFDALFPSMGYYERFLNGLVRDQPEPVRRAMADFLRRWTAMSAQQTKHGHNMSLQYFLMYLRDEIDLIIHPYNWPVKDRFAADDAPKANAIFNAIAKSPDAPMQAHKIVETGPFELAPTMNPYYFNATTVPARTARVVGLNGFLDAVNSILRPTGGGFAALQGNVSYFPEYFANLFADHPEAQALVKDWLRQLNDMPDDLQVKNDRLMRFFGYLRHRLNLVANPISRAVVAAADAGPKTDSAQTSAEYGGIDLTGRIRISAGGARSSEPMSDKALEDLLVKSKGVRAVITGITPVPKMADILK